MVLHGKDFEVQMAHSEQAPLGVCSFLSLADVTSVSLPFTDVLTVEREEL